MSTNEEKKTLDFIRQVVEEDNRTGKWEGRVVTRFPPEPNGYLHIGHAKSICLNFGLAEEYGGTCHLRYDDTNPTREEQRYIDAIKEDLRWLGFDWGEHEYYASDYYQQLFDWAVDLVRKGLAYVDDLSAEEIRAHRGTLTTPGIESPFRGRSVEENLDLFERMRAGEFADGEKVLRAKIDMASPNINLRDPVMYRIMRATHPRTADAWCIYPTYDWAHGQSDSIESITHSICTLEFEDHRPLYDWFLDSLEAYHPQQVEFAPLAIGYTVMSKRKLRELVEGAHVDGWDDPRMPTLSGMRRRGFPAGAIRAFLDAVGVGKSNQMVEMARLEYELRQDLNLHAPRRMAVLDPIRVVIENWPEDRVEETEAVNNPEDEGAGTRMLPFSRELWIERDDFMEEPPRKFFRLAPGREVRLRYAYWITCRDVVKDEAGEIVEIRCTYDPETKGGKAPPDGRKVKATIHWLSAAHALDAEVRLYDHLFTKENPADVDEGGSWLDNINPESLTIREAAKVEASLGGAKPGEACQFERLGYFCADPDGTPERPVFNRTVTLRDAWAKARGKK